VMTTQQVAEAMAKVRAAVSSRVVGQDEVVDQALVAFLARGHALLEGVPGTAKTLLIRVLAGALHARFGRIQFTPDLMPSDITGINVLRDGGRTAEFRGGPIFTDLLLADEINRAPAKTQSALLEAMQERQVTVDGAARPLGEAQCRELRTAVDAVKVAPEVRDYIANIVRATREDPALTLGGSPRASVALFRVGRAAALMAGRDYVTPDDVKGYAFPVLRHRITVAPEVEVEGRTSDEVLQALLLRVPAPQ